MSMMTLLRRAFGFSADNEDDEDYNPSDPTYAACGQSSGDDSRNEPVPDRDDATGAKDINIDSIPSELFDAVIEVFNNDQPDFVRQCLNIEAQRRYLISSISERLQIRIDSLVRSGEQKWIEEKNILEKRISELESDENETSRLRKENRRLQLSVDRQKRAMLDRINDLESQVARQNEEKERFYSKRHAPEKDELVKANARIKELEDNASDFESRKTDLEARRTEFESQRIDFESQKNDFESQKTDFETQCIDFETRKTDFESEKTQFEYQKNEFQQYKDDFGQQRDEFEQAKLTFEQERAELIAECEKLREEVGRQTILKEQLEVKTSMSDAMINDLRNQAASARNELEKMRHEQETIMEQIREQLDGFEDLKARKDSKIAELQEANASLRRTIETNLYNQANSEMRLRSEIKQLKARLEKLSPKTDEDPVGELVNTSSGIVPGDRQPEVKNTVRRRGRPKKVRIDNELDNTDWFSGGSKGESQDFGYHEPPRRPVNDNEAQLTLF